MSDVLFLAMFLTALPKLLNLQELIFTGNNEVWNTLAAQLGLHASETCLPHDRVSIFDFSDL